jgi:hypothetical protein
MYYCVPYNSKLVYLQTDKGLYAHFKVLKDHISFFGTISHVVFMFVSVSVNFSVHPLFQLQT